MLGMQYVLNNNINKRKRKADVGRYQVMQAVLAFFTGSPRKHPLTSEVPRFNSPHGTGMSYHK